jgi:adenylate cyclase
LETRRTHRLHPLAGSVGDLDDGRIISRYPLPRDLKKATEYIRNDRSKRISIASLADHCGVSERTLEKHFRLFLNCSPFDFWQRTRLSAARQELLKGSTNTSVLDVAATFGFTHMGRFSQQYRRCFDETPSATLRRGRQAQRDRIRAAENVRATDSVGLAAIGARQKPSVAILPSSISASEPACRSFGEYLTEGITVALGRARSLSVIAPSRPYRARPSDPQSLPRDIGARYLLATRIAQSGQRVRVTARLFEAATDGHIWGDTYDGELDALFELQDRIIAGVTRAILPQIRGFEIERAQRKRPQDLDGYGLVMRAFPFVFATNPSAAQHALDLLNRAMEIDPDYAPAAGLAAWCHAQLVLYNGTGSPSSERERALVLSDRAGILDGDDPLVLTARCAVHTMAQQLDHADALVARVLALDPTFVWGWERSGWINAYTGKPETAISHFKQATRLDAEPPNASRLIGIGCAHFDAERYREAALWKQQALRKQPSTAWINRTLSVSYARLGDRLAALDAIDALRRYSPDVTIDQVVASIPFRPEFLDRVAEGLHDLRLPD